MVGFSRKRPRIISIFCIIGWIMVILNFMQAFSPSVKKIGEFYPALSSLAVCLQFIALVGVWYMKRWGTEVFIFAFLCRMALAVLMNDFTLGGTMFWASLSISGTIILLALMYYSEMDLNL